MEIIPYQDVLRDIIQMLDTDPSLSGLINANEVLSNLCIEIEDDIKTAVIAGK